MALALSLAITTGLLLTAVFLFRRMEKTFADVL